MVKRRLRDAGLPVRLSPHSFRVTGITDLLSQGVPLDDVQFLAGHSSPRTTKLYDRRQKKVTRNIVERISIRLAICFLSVQWNSISDLGLPRFRGMLRHDRQSIRSEIARIESSSTTDTHSAERPLSK